MKLINKVNHCISIRVCNLHATNPNNHCLQLSRAHHPADMAICGLNLQFLQLCRLQYVFSEIQPIVDCKIALIRRENTKVMV